MSEFAIENGELVVPENDEAPQVTVRREDLESADFERAADGESNGALVLVRKDGSREVLSVSEEEARTILGDLRNAGVEGEQTREVSAADAGGAQDR